MKKIQPIVLILIAVLILALGALTYVYQAWEGTKTALSEREADVSSLEEELSTLTGEYDVLEDAFESEKARNDAFANEIADISGTVGKLDKLSRTDPELLQKYSKVFFLSEHYAPEAFEKLPPAYVFGEEDEYVSKQVWPFLKELFEDAKDDGVNLGVVSAFRSFGEQGALKASYTVQYGSGANAFSADQGYSEHQLGTTVDFSSNEVGGGLNNFDTTTAYTWLVDNAYKYGFVLSYPKGNAYYIYEPWHWRFVGTELARDLHKDGKHFYDLDQRELDAYLVDIFD